MTISRYTISHPKSAEQPKKKMTIAVEQKFLILQCSFVVGVTARTLYCMERYQNPTALRCPLLQPSEHTTPE